MTERIQRLRAYVAAGARLPFVWGESDCCPWAAGWVLADRGIDPLAAVRGSYSSRFGCARFLLTGGGLVALVARSMAAAGFADTREPALGDVGLIAAPVGPMGAIRCEANWAVKARDGVAFIEAVPLMAWRI